MRAASSDVVVPDSAAGPGERFLRLLPPAITLTVGRHTLCKKDVEDKIKECGWNLAKLPEELLHEFVRYASEASNVQALRLLQQSGAWVAEDSVLALRVAHEAGTLTHLLCAFELPLSDFPVIAQAHEDEALGVLNGEVEISQGPRTQHDGLSAPTSQARLLANYLLVPSRVAETVMSQVVENMVVFMPTPFSQQLPLDPASCRAEYPLQFSLVEARDKAQLHYNPLKKTVRLGHRGPEHSTSAESTVALTLESRKAAAIPEHAKSFAYVHSSDEMPCGGFLFLDKNGRACALHQITFDADKQEEAAVLKFGEPVVLSPLRDDILKDKVRVGKLEDAGVKHYVWVGRDARPFGLADSGCFGGFVFMYEGEKEPQFFPVVAARRPKGGDISLESQVGSIA